MRLKHILISAAVAGLLASPALGASWDPSDPNNSHLFTITSSGHAQRPDNVERVTHLTGGTFAQDILRIEVNGNFADANSGVILFTFHNDAPAGHGEIEEIYIEDGNRFGTGAFNFLSNPDVVATTGSVFGSFSPPTGGSSPFENGSLSPALAAHWVGEETTDTGNLGVDFGLGIGPSESVSIAFDFNAAGSGRSVTEAADLIRFGLHYDFDSNEQIGSVWGIPIIDHTGVSNFASESYWADMPLVNDQGNPVPEPGSLALLATGLVGLVGLARRKRSI